MSCRFYQSAAIAKSYAEFRPTHPLQFVDKIRKFQRKYSKVEEMKNMI